MLIDIVNDYARFRNLVKPDANDSLLFLQAEVGELADAFVHDKQNWVRNDPDRARSIEHEIGDVLMMLTRFSEQMGFNPEDCMRAKFASKGWEPGWQEKEWIIPNG